MAILKSSTYYLASLLSSFEVPAAGQINDLHIKLWSLYDKLSPLVCL